MDKSEKQLADIARSLGVIESTTSDIQEGNETLVRIADRLDQISERLDRLVELNEHQAQAAIDMMEKAAADEDEDPLGDSEDDSSLQVF